MFASGAASYLAFSGSGSYGSGDQDFDDPEIDTLFARHKGWVSVDLCGDALPWVLQEAYCTIARVLREMLWHEPLLLIVINTGVSVAPTPRGDGPDSQPKARMPGLASQHPSTTSSPAPVERETQEVEGRRTLSVFGKQPGTGRASAVEGL